MLRNGQHIQFFPCLYVNKQIMLLADVATEFVGTFFFVATIIATSGQAIAAGVALAGVQS